MKGGRRGSVERVGEEVLKHRSSARRADTGYGMEG